jgi:probable HAF family extracellular repeat protein
VTRLTLVAVLLVVACGGNSSNPGTGSGGGGADAGTTRATLRVDLAGQGSVSSTPAGINCASSCSAQFDQGSRVQLRAQPGTGWHLAAWGGTCSGTGDCVVTVAADSTVSATFAADTPAQTPRKLTVAISGPGKGRVRSSPVGIDCSSNCEATFPDGTDVSLTASAEPGSSFDHWSGACSDAGACSVKLAADASVEGVFSQQVPPPPSQGAYSVVELPPVDGVYVLKPFAINGKGDVVGSYEVVFHGEPRAFLYDASSGSARRIMDHGQNGQTATGINDARQVAGMIYNRAVRWENHSETDIGALSESKAYAFPWVINAKGQIAGSSLGDDNNLHAVFWDGSSLRPLAPNAGFTIAYGLNNNGVAVGVRDLSGAHPVVFEKGEARDLGSLGGRDGGIAFAINDSGRIVGRASTATGASHAFTYDLPSGPMRDVSPDAGHCQLTGINAIGGAVGQGDRGVVVLRGSTVEYLEDLAADPSWKFIDARALNDRGQVTGWGSHNGQERAFIATPR